MILQPPERPAQAFGLHAQTTGDQHLVIGQRHLTGAALARGKFQQELGHPLRARLRFQLLDLRQGLFGWLQQQGRMEAAELARTFNCGIGMILAVAPADAVAVADALTGAGETVFTVGRIVPGAKGCEVRGSAGHWGQAEGWVAAHDA